MAETLQHALAQSSIPVPEATDYRVTVSPSVEPNKGQFMWSVSLVAREDGEDKVVRFVGWGTNDAKSTCFEQADELIQRDRLGVEVQYRAV
jgi:hypothetical protein